MMKLIGSLSSPFVRKTRIVLADKKIDYKLVLENVGRRISRSTHSIRWARCRVS